MTRVTRCLRALLVLLAVSGDAPAEAEQAVPLGVSFSDVLELPAAAPDHVEPYGDDERQRREFWLPPGDRPHPVVVLIHGGCWQNAFAVDHVRPLASALRTEGFAVVAPEYRRIGDAGGGWPGTFEDIAAAIDGLAASALATRLDLGRVALVGHSAGGHLALWAGSRAAEDGALQPALVVGLAAITDLETYAHGSSSCQRATTELLGGMPESVPERYQRVSPVLRASGEARRVLLHGTADAIVAPTQAAALVAVDPDVEPVLIGGAGHFDMIHPGTRVFVALLEAIAPIRGAGR